MRQKKFMAFLKKNRAYSKYCRAWIEQGMQNNVADRDYSGHILATQFTWSLTKEGHNYWCNLSEKWFGENMPNEPIISCTTL